MIKRNSKKEFKNSLLIQKASWKVFPMLLALLLRCCKQNIQSSEDSSSEPEYSFNPIGHHSQSAFSARSRWQTAISFISHLPFFRFLPGHSLTQITQKDKCYLRCEHFNFNTREWPQSVICLQNKSITIITTNASKKMESGDRRNMGKRTERG